MITQLAHVCLGSTNLAQTEHFYCTVLGLKKHFRFLRDGREFGFYLHLGQNTFIEVFEQKQIEVNKLSPIRHLCLQVSSVDKMIDRLRSHGHTVTDKKLGADGSWQCWLTDPDSVQIELHEYTPQSTQITGKDCILAPPTGNKPSST